MPGYHKHHLNGMRACLVVREAGTKSGGVDSNPALNMLGVYNADVTTYNYQERSTTHGSLHKIRRTWDHEHDEHKTP